jgi:integrase
MVKHLSVSFIRTAPPGQYPDPEVRGLRLAVGKSARTWIYRYRMDAGERRVLRQVVIGHDPAMPLEKARERVRDLKANRAVGGDPQRIFEREQEKRAELGKQAARERYTVLALLDHYMQEHVFPSRKPKGAKDAARLFLRLPAEFLHAPAPGVRKAAAHELVQRFEARSIRRMVGRELRAAWDHALAAGRLDEGLPNPFYKLKLPAQGFRDRALSLDELKALLPWIDRLPPMARDVLRVTLLTGMRTGEVAGALTQHLNGGTLLLPKTKNGKARTVQLPRQAAAILHARAAAPRKRKADALHLFPSPMVRGAAIRQNAVVLACWNARESRPVEFKPHDLRRTCATQLAELGLADADLIELILGHAREGIRKIYNRSERADEQRAALQAWADRLDALQAG